MLGFPFACASPKVVPRDENATYRPSPEIEGSLLSLFPGTLGADSDTILMHFPTVAFISRTKACRAPGATAVRLVAEDSKATQRPSADTTGFSLSPSVGTPPTPMETSSVTPVSRLRRNTSKNPFVSPGTSVLAVVANTTNRPSREMTGLKLTCLARAQEV